jgi:hypothetical protein
MQMRKLIFIFAFCWFGANLFGQTSSLTGTVTDPTGAVIPGAQITLTNVKTGALRSTASNETGHYTMAQLTPGTYQLVAKSPGFTDVAIKSIELLVDSPATINIKFEKLGGVTTTVQVEAAAVQINTVDASLGNAISTQAIMELPMYARNVAGLLAFQPGVTSFGAFGQGSLDDRNGSVNGSKADQSNVTLDGADVNDQNTRAAFTSVLRVTLDSVEEFRTTTTNAGADTGRGSGANISLVTKSGTNELHGSLYEYRRGTETAANSFFDNAAGVPIAPLLINVFGASAGGPIKKNKAFFFVNYEGRRDASATSLERTIPNDLLRQGIVSYHDKTTGALKQLTPDQVKQVDPAGIGESPGVLQIFQNVYPHGNDPSYGDGLNTTGYLFNAPQHSKQDTYIAKFDYKLDEAGKHNLFVRGNLQNDHSSGTPQFPGQPPRSVGLANSKGMAAGWTGVFGTNMVSTFRYGLTRAGNQSTGTTQGSYEWLRGLDTPYSVTTGTARIIPVHTFSEDFAWTHGSHDFRFGAVVRVISNQSVSTAHSYDTASSNPSWLKGSGSDLNPASLNVRSSDKNSFQYAMGAVLGVMPQATGNYNYLVDGTLLPTGAPVTRSFANKETEAYAQDTWKVTHNFTITAGLRFGYQPPVHEANGQQVSPDISLSDWNAQRAALAAQGLSQQGAGKISFVVADSPQGRPMYPTHYTWAPRLGLAYSPKGESGLAKWLFGGAGKTSIRAGFGMYYDEIGQPLAQTFNNSAFGLQSTLTSSANILTTAQAPRFTTFWAVPSSIITAAPKGGFPQTYPDLFSITNTVDDTLKAPYTMNMNLTFGREFGHGLFVQLSYVGRLSRHSLINQDLGMPTNPKDPQSGQTYFQAWQQLARLVDDQGVAVKNLPKIPFFEKFWATAAAGGYTATQIWALDYLENSTQGDFTNTLNDADNAANCSTSGTTFFSDGTVNHPGCSIYGPWFVFNPQYSALSAWSSIGAGDYHAAQLTIRKRFSQGLMFDFNYTLSKSIDLASTPENGGSFAGMIQNTWFPGQNRAVSDFDTLHAVNFYSVWQLPFGRGHKFGAGMNKVVDAFLGGWQISGTWRQTSGLPTTVSNDQRWPTNWENDAWGVPNGNPMPPVTNNKNALGINGVRGPNLWDDPQAAFDAYHYCPAGESGLRNNIRGAGYFGIDSSVSKTFNMPWKESHKLQIRWETFNLTNTIRFDPTSNPFGDAGGLMNANTFGKLTGQLGAPRQMQFALRYIF